MSLDRFPPAFPFTRRRLLMAGAALPLAACGVLRSGAGTAQATQQLARLEEGLSGRLGVLAFDTGSGAVLGHRAHERFPMCSTFKAVLAAAVLARSVQSEGLLDAHVRYRHEDLIAHSPITGRQLAQGMTVAELCAATVQYSDNAAANLLMQRLGGPQAVTEFARSVGDAVFRLDRWETELNTALAGDERDTTTPDAMARLLGRLVLGEALPTLQRAQLVDWLRGNTTGDRRIRAGVPASWRVGDKTGTGVYGAASDIGVVWRPGAAPLVLAIYTRLDAPEASPRDDVIAAATRIAVQWAGA